MSSMIPMAASSALQNAQIRNNGGQAGFLGGPGAIDGTSQSLWNALDPADISGKASSGHILANVFDPGNVFGMNQAANPHGPSANGNGSGVPSVLPTLPGVGAPTLYNPASFGGLANLGSGRYNAMASQMAGPQYRPMPMPGGPPQQKPGQASGAGGVPLVGTRNPIGIGMTQPVMRARQ